MPVLHEHYERLPRKYAVACAVRSARRVQFIADDFFRQSGWRDAGDIISDIERALVAAEHFSRHGENYQPSAYAALGVEVIRAKLAAEGLSSAAANAAFAAYHAVYACARSATREHSAADHATQAAAAARDALEAAFKAGDEADTAAVSDVMFAEEFTSSRAKSIEPGPDGPFGSYWRNGEPDWRARSSGEQDSPTSTASDEAVDSLVLEISIPDDATKEDIASAVKQYVGALDQLHRAHGKSGLKINSLEVEGFVAAEVPQS